MNEHKSENTGRRRGSSRGKNEAWQRDGDSDRKHLEALVRDRVAPAVAELGWDARSGESELTRQLRGDLLRAFGVLGNAATEEGWVAVMDNIDAASREPFERREFLGGVRLLPPTTGRRIATEGARRAVFDGPFLESKEVIGGLFFARMTSIDEAVRWASETDRMVTPERMARRLLMAAPHM